MQKTLIVLKALFQGIPIKNKNSTIVCSENDEIAIKIDDEKCYTIEWPINDFIKFCNKMSDDEIAILAAELALNKQPNWH